MASSTQLVTRIPKELASALDELVDRGVFDSRSDAVREGLGMLVDTERRRAIGEAIVEGYRRIPPNDEEFGAWADANAQAMIDEEPW